MADFESRTVSLRHGMWDKIDLLIEKGKGAFRNRSHLIEYLLQQNETVDSLVEEVRRDG